MSILVIGGTGSLGSKLVPLLLQSTKDRIRILSRGEHKQIEMARRFGDPRIDFLVGDVRDRDRIFLAAEGCHSVFHLAANKSVDHMEYNPREAVKTNILGTENVIDACRELGVGRAMFISTDKAVASLNTYGRTKAVAESEWILANCGAHTTNFSACRYGNVFGSNSSVLQLWRDGNITLTDETMTRFFISLGDAAAFVFCAWRDMTGGEIYIPKMKATTMKRLLEAATGQAEYELIGRRPGEKIHEVLITSDESEYTTDVEWGYIRWPLSRLFPFFVHGKVLPRGYSLSSDVAPQFSDEELKKMMEEWKSGLHRS